jgi:hypothetical protein
LTLSLCVHTTVHPFAAGRQSVGAATSDGIGVFWLTPLPLTRCF